LKHACMLVCVCACVRACVHVCVCVCVREREGVFKAWSSVYTSMCVLRVWNVWESACFYPIINLNSLCMICHLAE
jgi:hypothetical protein